MIATRLRDLRRHIVAVHLRALPDALLNLGAIHQQMHHSRTWDHTHRGECPTHQGEPRG